MQYKSWVIEICLKILSFLDIIDLMYTMSTSLCRLIRYSCNFFYYLDTIQTISWILFVFDTLVKMLVKIKFPKKSYYYKYITIIWIEIAIMIRNMLLTINTISRLKLFSNRGNIFNLFNPRILSSILSYVNPKHL